MVSSRHAATLARMRTKALHRRLATLRNLEWFNVPLLGLVLLWYVPAQRDETVFADTWQRTLAFLPVAGLLIAGGWYWHRKLHQLRNRRPLEDALVVLDHAGRAARAALSLLTALLAASWVMAAGRLADRGWATALVVMGWLEYVNYFRVQLMHDTRADIRRLAQRGRFRRSALRRDLEAG